MSVRVTSEACAIIARRRRALGAASRDNGRCWRRWSTLVERPLRALVLRRRATRGACWPDEAPLAGRVARPRGRCWSRRYTPLDARCRAPACALAAHVISDGGRRPAAAPGSFRRCRDGWSDFF
ncbi:hypothetical protein F511_46228 [Dorcoceras hygrometricum]|uniref:Uncharacterized protein n=1 Tax=Dorcoceras hygrometricum TaxID=472368 RepID=A0A2Z6ZU28_9LAMI|nr:hypothetical protein F511_46228 [Dorcoceras hygrometricum]